MKLIKRISFILVITLVALLAVGYVLGRIWGSDQDSIDLKAQRYAFQAKRDDMGIWRVEAQGQQNLAFAFGYLHAHDREFQVELMRRVATGRLASWFGESQVKRDKLMRHIARLAKWEWEQTQKDRPELAEFLKSYVAGINWFRNLDKASLPVEYRVFRILRSDIETWEEWEILAISRYHAWMLSSDRNGELLRHNLEKELGSPLARLLFPAEGKEVSSLYGQAERQNFLTKEFPSTSKVAPDVFASVLSTPWSYELDVEKKKESQSEKKGSRFDYLDPEQSQVFFDALGTAEFGASNMWLTYSSKDKKRGVSLCNDTHLQSAWPSVLYPIKYNYTATEEEQSKGLKPVKAEGFSFPGSPLLVIGRIERSSESGSEKLIWGITSANFADSENYVFLKDETPFKLGAQESIVVRDPLDGSLDEEYFQSRWTPWGPRIDGLLDGFNADGKAVALDWVGFRKTRSPIYFFYRRNFYASEGIEDELSLNFDLPAVNFVWMGNSNDSNETQMGHVMTGWTFEDANPARRLARSSFVDSTHSSQLPRLSSARERSYLRIKLDSEKDFLLATANQRVWSGDLALKLAYSWGSPRRIGRILELKDDLLKSPEFAQTDRRSLSILSFYEHALNSQSAGDLCSWDSSDRCLETLSAMGSWDGNFDLNSSTATVAALWYQLTLEEIWNRVSSSERGSKSGELNKEVFGDWVKSMAARSFLYSLLNDDQFKKDFMMLVDIDFSEVFRSSFQKSLELLNAQSNGHFSSWKWGHYHQMKWQHPFALLPGAAADYLMTSVVGPPLPLSGEVESPGVNAFKWNSEDPLAFSSVHTATMRFCASLNSEGDSELRWANLTGVSGNPFSKWARVLPAESWLQDRLIPSD